VRFGRHDRLLYATDASLYQVEPIGVVVPASIDDAVRVVRFCAGRDVALLPRGGGTSLAGQCVNRAVVMDFTPMCRGLRGVDVAGRTCTVEPGIGIDELNEQLAARGPGGGAGLFFAPDPATSRQAAVGGCIGNNGAGARSIRYGRTSENVEALEVCLSTGQRVWLGPGAGARDPVARDLAARVIEVVRRHAGEIRARFPRTVRRNAGYGLDMVLDQVEAGATPETLDLSKLLCGSEGTLAVTLQARLKLHPTPTAKGLAVVSFRSLEDAIAATKPIIDACLGLGLTAVELLDDVVLDAARGNLEYREYVNLLPGADAATSQPKAALYVEFFGFEGGKGDVERGFAGLRALMEKTPGVMDGGVATYTDAGAMLRAWALRKAGEPLLHGLPGARKPITFVEDNAVPVERLGEFVREFKKIVTRHGTRAAYWAHASVGVLHVRPMIDLHDPADRERMRAIAVEVADLARACGGIMSGEHGDGRVRGPLIERFFGAELMGAFREIKRIFDPQGLLNPGMIVSPESLGSITDHLRVDAERLGHQATHPHLPSAAPKAVLSRFAGEEARQRPDPVETYFDYSDSDGFLHAAEQCNGAGVCRKRTGVMCPSYHATLDERHSTRGRGNALRLAITGQLPGSAGRPGFDDPETMKTLDLCLSCKACKSECPSNVDIARLKAEYTAQRYRQSGKVPLAALATGHVRVLNRVGAIAPGLASAVSASGPARAFINRVMNIHPERSLPKFSRSLYSALRPAPARPGQSRVVLYADCFTTYNESRIGVAAGRVLEKLGYAVSLSPSVCCGRSMISVGMLEQAISTIDAAVEALRPAIEDDAVKAVVVCEPSCLSAMKDDWLALKCRTPLGLRQRLADKAMLPEQFIEAAWETHPVRPVVDAGGLSGKVLLHAHCHQKALWGAASSAALLARLVGERLKVLDTGCCGMAGSFGYDAERYGVSMKIAELALLPAVRRAGPGDVLVAPGTSCRHQVHDGTGGAREALHPIELVDMLLK
jgi:FAD/FMN-containing dehydrogenase/Fe-S oxidoreductase